MMDTAITNGAKPIYALTMDACAVQLMVDIPISPVLNEVADGCVRTMQQNWARYLRLIEHFCNAIRDPIRLYQLLLLNLDTDTKSRSAIRQGDKSFCICDRCKASFDTNSDATKQGYNRRRIRFVEIGRRRNPEEHANWK